MNDFVEGFIKGAKETRVAFFAQVIAIWRLLVETSDSLLDPHNTSDWIDTEICNHAGLQCQIPANACVDDRWYRTSLLNPPLFLRLLGHEYQAGIQDMRVYMNAPRLRRATLTLPDASASPQRMALTGVFEYFRIN